MVTGCAQDGGPGSRSPWYARKAASALILALAVIQGGESWVAYEHCVDNVRTQLAERTLSAARQVEVGLRAVEALLDETALNFHPHAAIPEPALVDHFRGRIRGMPELADAIVVGADGHIIAPNLTDGKAIGIDLSDRPYFLHHRDQPRKAGLFIWPPVDSRAVNRPSIPASRSLQATDGSFAGFVAADIDPRFFEAVLRSVTPEGRASAAVLALDGLVLARIPDAEDLAGKRAAVDLPALAGRHDFVFGRSAAALDKVERFVGYQGVASYPVMVSAALPVEDSLAEWRGRSAKAVGVFLVLGTAIWVLALLADRREAARMVLTADLKGHRERLEQEVADRTRHFDLARAEAQLHGDRLALVLKGANDGWWDWDLTADQLYFSPRWWAMLGYRPDELPADESLWTRLVHPEDAECARAVFVGALKQDVQSYEVEFRLRHRDGHYVPVLSRGYVLRDPAGRAVRVSGTNMDLSERKRAEEALRASEAKLRAMFELSPLGMARTAMDGRFLDANPAFLAIVGRELDDLNRLSNWDLTPPRYIEEETRQMAVLQAERAYGPYEKEYFHASGRLVPVRLRGVLVVGTDGETSIWSMVEDISLQHASRQALIEKSKELARSNADLEQFAYVASHDMREPLRMVSSYMALLERRYADRLDQDAREFIAFARDGAARLDRLVLDLLDYSRVKRLGEEMVSTSALSAVTAAIDILRDSIEAAGGEVEVDGPLPVVVAAPIQLQRLFQNLIGNALKYRADDRPPRIRISAEAHDGEWVFAVADNGLGIDPQYYERIFGIFQRLHTRERYEGTGIGLAICRSIVERHNGRIWVDSSPDGSVFRFTLKMA